MPSTITSRRRLLAGSAGALSVALAGCSGIDESHSGSASDSVDGRTTLDDEYDVVSLRASDDDAFVYPSEEEADDDSADEYRLRHSTFFVVDEEEADAVYVDPSVADDGDVRTFLAETDFESESVAVETRVIEDCYRRRVLGVRADPDEFRVDYCRTLKEPTEPCEADRDVAETYFFRVQRAYEDAPSSRGSSESGSCWRPNEAGGGGSDAANETSSAASQTNGTAEAANGTADASNETAEASNGAENASNGTEDDE